MKNKITIVKRDTAKIKKFEEKEWRLANIERYGNNKLAKKKTFKLVASDEDGNTVGVLALLVDNNIAYLDGLLVSSKHRRQGIGKELVLFAENLAKKNKCTKIIFETEENWTAPKFYKSLDYKITGKHENHYFGTRCLIFTKYL